MPEPPSLLDLHPGPPAETGETQSRTVTAVIGLIVLVLLAGGTILVVSRLSTHHTSPTAASTSHPSSAPFATTRSGSPTSTTPSRPTAQPTPAGQVAAATVSNDLATSVAARKLIGPANNHIADCRATAADVSALDRAATIRTGLVTDLGRLDVRGLAGGTAVVARLRAAWTYSARADSAYAAWGRHHLGCTGHAKTTGDADWTRAQHNDALSTANKKDAVTLWNPIARRYHLPTRTSGTI